MAPVPDTEDYYLILEVEQTASSEIITKSYRRLALKLHPDRNAKHDATATFQRLQQAYETLSDEARRRTYDINYAAIRLKPSAFGTNQSTPSARPTTQVSCETTQIAAIQKAKRERMDRWHTQKVALESKIFDIKRDIRRLEQQIANLKSIAAAEAKKKAWENGWTAWMISPLYKKREESEEEMLRNDRERQERAIERDMKQRRLDNIMDDLKKQEDMLRSGQSKVNAANTADDGRVYALGEKIRARETRERMERERKERERQAEIWRQEQEKRDREAAERLKKFWAEWREAEAKRQEEEAAAAVREAKRRSNRYTRASSSFPQACNHAGWWPKEYGRKPCPECGDVWNWLLECPGCRMKACNKCQAILRPKRGVQPNYVGGRARSPSPVYYDHDWWD